MANEVRSSPVVGQRLGRLVCNLGEIAREQAEWSKSMAAGMPGLANNDRKHLLAALERMRDDAEAWAKELRREGG